MKIALGMNLQTGPWGGGNQFGWALKRHLEDQAVAVVHDLGHPDLDLILLAEPRRNLRISAFSEAEIFRHLARNPRALVVHRVNECDERKGGRGVNQRLLRANLAADHTVFVSAWLRDLYLAQGLDCPSHSVILNGSDQEVFHPRGHQPWDGRGPVRLVTHHWSSHRLKGFDIYEQLDQMLGQSPWRERYEFSYVGQLAEGYAFAHSRYVAPLHGSALADELRQAHVYLTASRNEPGSNHQNEGALCGLPLLYLPTGGLTEYCQGFGLAFADAAEFPQRLEQMRTEYPRWAGRMAAYPHTAQRTCAAWLELMRDLVARRDQVLAARRPRRRLRWLGRTLRERLRGGLA